MDDNPYKATMELRKESPRLRRGKSGYLVLGTGIGTVAAFIFTFVFLTMYGYEFPRNAFIDAYEAFIPVTCVVPTACVGALGGAIWEYYVRW